MEHHHNSSSTKEWNEIWFSFIFFGLCDDHMNIFMNISIFHFLSLSFRDYILAALLARLLEWVSWVKAHFVLREIFNTRRERTTTTNTHDSSKSIVQTIEKVGTIYLLKPRPGQCCPIVIAKVEQSNIRLETCSQKWMFGEIKWKFCWCER